MAREGFGVCLKDPSPGAYYPASYKRDCERFEQAEQNQTDNRIQWLAKRRWTISA